MEERTVYVSQDGIQFSDPDLCRAYEQKLNKWYSALSTVSHPSYLSNLATEGSYSYEEEFNSLLNLADWPPRSYPTDPARRHEEAIAFLQRLEYLQRLAAFMAAEE